MNTLTKLVLGKMGRLRPKPLPAEAVPALVLPPPERQGGAPLTTALAARRSSREFAPRELALPLLSSLLWAANGINRPDGGRTSPSAMNAQEIDIFVALAGGTFRYDAPGHQLKLVASNDVRQVTGYQDFVDHAPMDLVYVASHTRMHLVPVQQRTAYAFTAAGAIAQNVYLYAAANGLATVLRAWIDREAIADALGLTHDDDVLLSQTVGYPRDGST